QSAIAPHQCRERAFPIARAVADGIPRQQLRVARLAAALRADLPDKPRQRVTRTHGHTPIRVSSLHGYCPVAGARHGNVGGKVEPGVSSKQEELENYCSESLLHKAIDKPRRDSGRLRPGATMRKTLQATSQNGSLS